MEEGQAQSGLVDIGYRIGGNRNVVIEGYAIESAGDEVQCLQHVMLVVRGGSSQALVC